MITDKARVTFECFYTLFGFRSGTRYYGLVADSQKEMVSSDLVATDKV